MVAKLRLMPGHLLQIGTIWMVIKSKGHIEEEVREQPSKDSFLMDFRMISQTIRNSLNVRDTL